LNQRKIADYVVRQRQAHYHFTVKNNQPGLFEDIALYFQDRQQPDFVLCDPPDHGRIEIRKIWTTSELNDYLNFSHVGQAFVIQRESTDKKPVITPVTSPTGPNRTIIIARLSPAGLQTCRPLPATMEYRKVKVL